MTKVIPILALTTPLPCIFLQIAPCNAEADAIKLNGAKMFLAKVRANFNGPANLPNKVPRTSPY